MRKFIAAASCIVCLLPSTLMGDFTQFDIRPFFETAALDGGNVLTGFEDFEDNNLGISEGVLLPPDETLQFGTPLLGDGGLGFTNGLSTDLITIDAFGTDIGTSWVLESTSSGNSRIAFGFGLEINFTAPVTAFGLDFNAFAPDSPLPVELLDGDGQVALSFLFQEEFGFLGFVADNGDTISSIRIGDPNNIIDLPDVDNFQIFQQSIYFFVEHQLASLCESPLGWSTNL